MSFGMVAASYFAVEDGVYRYGFENGSGEASYFINTPAVALAPIVADTAQAAHGSLSLRTNNDTGYHFVQKDFSSAITDAAVHSRRRCR